MSAVTNKSAETFDQKRARLAAAAIRQFGHRGVADQISVTDLTERSGAPIFRTEAVVRDDLIIEVIKQANPDEAARAGLKVPEKRSLYVRFGGARYSVDHTTSRAFFRIKGVKVLLPQNLIVSRFDLHRDSGGIKTEEVLPYGAWLLQVRPATETDKARFEVSPYAVHDVLSAPTAKGDPGVALLIEKRRRRVTKVGDAYFIGSKKTKDLYPLSAETTEDVKARLATLHDQAAASLR